MRKTNSFQMNMTGLMCGMYMCGMAFDVEKIRLRKSWYGLCKE